MLEAGFMDGRQGPFFYVFHPPAQQPARGAVLYFHPFAEEMNKSRRMAALQARRFAVEGYAVLLTDHYGCGDSGGDFGDARWETWLNDIGIALDWLQQRTPGPLMLWGLRTGCLLLSDLVRERRLDPASVILWQPVVNGEQYLNQFLRLRMAASMMGGGKETTKALREALAGGEMLEVAGYALSPALAASLAGARFEAPSRGPVYWIEVVASTGGVQDISPAYQRDIDSWRENEIDVRPVVVGGEPFWVTQEITEVPGLIESTVLCAENVFEAKA